MQTKTAFFTGERASFRNLNATRVIATTVGVIFGHIPGMSDPERIQSTGMILLCLSAILYVASFIAAIGHELRRRYQSG